MKKFLFLLSSVVVFLALCLVPSDAQTGPGQSNYPTGFLYVLVAPSGSCSSYSLARVVVGPGTIYTCQNGIWASAGGSGTGSTGINVAGNPTPALWPLAYGVKADLNWRYDATTVSTTSVVTCPDCAFVAARDVGKCIQVSASASSGVVDLSAANGSPCITITSLNSATSVNVSANAVASVTGTGVVVWGTDDTGGWQAVDAAAAASDACPAITLPVGTSWVTKGMWSTQSAKCATSGLNIPYTYRAIYGEGPNESYIFVGGNFDYTTCASNNCFGSTAINQMHDFSIWGGGINNQCTGASGRIGLVISGFEASGIGVEGWCPNVTGFTGVKMISQQSLSNAISILDAGAIGLDVSKTQAEIHNGTFQGGDIVIEALASLTCIECNNAGTYGGVSGVNVSGIFYSHDSIWQSPGAQNAINILSGGVVYLQNDQVGTNGASASGLVVLNGGAAHILNTAFIGGSGGFPIFSQSTGNLYDECGNTFSGAGTLSVSGPYFGDCSTKALKVAASNLVLSGGWGSTASWTTPPTGYNSFVGTLTASGTGQGASPTITYTFPTQYFAAPQFCVLTIITTTQTLPAAFTPSSLTATGVVFTYGGTPTANATFNVQGTCYN